MHQLWAPCLLTVGLLRRLEKFRASCNHISGTLPKTLGNLESVRILELNRNRFTGTLPESLGNLTGVEMFSVNDNEALNSLVLFHCAPTDLTLTTSCLGGTGGSGGSASAINWNPNILVQLIDDLYISCNGSG